MLYEKRINSFFKSNKHKTFNNLCIYLDLTKNEFISLLNNEDTKDLFIKAHEKCEAWMIDNGLDNPKSGNFTQFLLRNQFGYDDKSGDDNAQPTTIQIVSV